jgi:hypothetical protein
MAAWLSVAESLSGIVPDDWRITRKTWADAWPDERVVWAWVALGNNAERAFAVAAARSGLPMTVAHLIFEKARWCGVILPDGSVHPAIVDMLDTGASIITTEARARLARAIRITMQEQSRAAKIRAASQPIGSPGAAGTSGGMDS